jgi:hypothetical protein
MPFMKCQSRGKKGVKYGGSGHCYTGKDAMEQATQQMKAIKASQAAAKKKK